LEPQERDIKGFEFVDEVKLAWCLPKEYIPAVDKGIQERMKNGVMAGYPVVGVKARVVRWFVPRCRLRTNCPSRWLASMAFRQGFRKADPVLLEPIMKPSKWKHQKTTWATVMGDLNRRRGMVQGMDDMVGGTARPSRLKSHLSEMFGYATSTAFDVTGSRNVLHGVLQVL
jgi:elongation factor G